jgi:hypothetical protein
MATRTPPADGQYISNHKRFSLSFVKIPIIRICRAFEAPLRTFVHAKAIVDYGRQAITMTAQEPIGIARLGAEKLCLFMVADLQMATLAAGLVMAGRGDAGFSDRRHQTLVAAIAAASKSGGAWQGIHTCYAGNVMAPVVFILTRVKAVNGGPIEIAAGKFGAGSGAPGIVDDRDFRPVNSYNCSDAGAGVATDTIGYEEVF